MEVVGSFMCNESNFDLSQNIRNGKLDNTVSTNRHIRTDTVS